ncbi:MAG: hypothetical protein M1828_002243 [Chrysothrix sp. TS-e1954]|nr:MAG: hypothetical protein M1828_002243 [Chrysothrix sp. TS-e1954]
MANASCSIYTILALLITSAFCQTVQYCGSQPYYPSAYTCYDGFLCPVLGTEPTLKCLNACYLPEAYICTNDTLSLHQPETNAFTLETVQAGIPSLNHLPITACGRRFYVGGGSCTYCPTMLGDTGCENFTNTTVFANTGTLDTEVPGGQQTYLAPDGSMGFTQAHSTSKPVGSDQGRFRAFDQGGYFTYAPSPQGWLACPVSGNAGSTATSVQYELLAAVVGGKVPALAAANQGCVPLKLRTVDVAQGTIGAWQYV